MKAPFGGSLWPPFLFESVEFVEVDFYLLPPEARWLPDGYEDDDVQALGWMLIPCENQHVVSTKRGPRPSSFDLVQWRAWLALLGFNHVHPMLCGCTVLYHEKYLFSSGQQSWDSKSVGVAGRQATGSRAQQEFHWLRTTIDTRMVLQPSYSGTTSGIYRHNNNNNNNRIVLWIISKKQTWTHTHIYIHTCACVCVRIDWQLSCRDSLWHLYKTNGQGAAF